MLWAFSHYNVPYSMKFIEKHYPASGYPIGCAG
jgi:hypothetical protein